MSQDLANHFRFFEELGVSGVNRDAAWRFRPSATGPSNLPAEPAEAGAPVSAAAASDRAAPVAKHPQTAPSETSSDAGRYLTMLREEIGPSCTRCKLHTLGRTQVVFGVGSPRADLMFVREAPGADEDLQGEPFVGRAGQLLTDIIVKGFGRTRDSVYIANVIKCRPPGNRNPEPDEVVECEPFLFRQIDVVKPKVVIALGKFAAQSLLRTTEPITRLRGRVFNYRGASLIPTFHPAFLLRNPSAKREVWEDVKKALAILRGDE
jgi:DNA polymerase